MRVLRRPYILLLATILPIWLVALGVLWAGLLILAAALLRIPVYQAGISSSPIVPGDNPA